MSHTITISDDTFARLQNCAIPFVDTEPQDVIRRLLDLHGGTLESRQPPAPPTGASEEAQHSLVSRSAARLPRQRGTTVVVDGVTISAVSVRDLYEQALKVLVDAHEQELAAVLPVRTSSQRYLVAQQDTHPNGRPFVIRVDYRGYYMEAHKDYKNAVSHLKHLVTRLGLSFEDLG